MLYNILKDQWQTIEIDRLRSITLETEFSQMAELLYDIVIGRSLTYKIKYTGRAPYSNYVLPENKIMFLNYVKKRKIMFTIG